jgi:hypothetical protein
MLVDCVFEGWTESLACICLCTPLKCELHLCVVVNCQFWRSAVVVKTALVECINSENLKNRTSCVVRLLLLEAWLISPLLDGWLLSCTPADCAAGWMVDHCSQLVTAGCTVVGYLLVLLHALNAAPS